VSIINSRGDAQGGSSGPSSGGVSPPPQRKGGGEERARRAIKQPAAPIVGRTDGWTAAAAAVGRLAGWMFCRPPWCVTPPETSALGKESAQLPAPGNWLRPSVPPSPDAHTRMRPPRITTRQRERALAIPISAPERNGGEKGGAGH
jgi:hypothetical protein